MRLINAHTLELEDFVDETTAKYAILSHRWQDEEVSFQAFQNLKASECLTGFGKIYRCCKQALHDGHSYVWCDTCCIDKTSSAELSEAINSMYRYYQAAQVCYVFLSDVEAQLGSQEMTEQRLQESLWFTRGWTLQELLAPENAAFYDKHWNFLGTKQTLCAVLSLRTGVDEVILEGKEAISERSIAQRMSWASRRTTTRREDMAYCLLGIFDVNMPMLYGEGDKAFIRLQQEIIRQSADHTIFAWPIPTAQTAQPGLLAESPAAFQECQNVMVADSRQDRSPYTMTNRGLSIQLLAIPFLVDTYLARLNCTYGSTRPGVLSPDDTRIGIFIRRLGGDDQYARVTYQGQTFVQAVTATWTVETRGSGHRQLTRLLSINVPQSLARADRMVFWNRINGFRICPELLEHTPKGKPRFQIMPSANFDKDRGIIQTPPAIARTAGTVGTLDISAQKRNMKRIKLGFDYSFNPICFITTSGDSNIDSRSPFDELYWSSRTGRSDTFSFDQSGDLWAVKGDRIDGLKARLGNVCSLRIERAEIGGELIWDVFIDDMYEGGVNKVMRRFLQTGTGVDRPKAPP